MGHTALRLALASLLPLAGLPAGAAAEGRLAAPPAWLERHLAYLVGGTWRTDNSAHRSEQEPSDAYATRWQWSVGRRSITGRLFGLRDGKEVATFWEFRLFWHPEERRAVIQQFGQGGVVGLGHTEPSGPERFRSEQRFLEPGGAASESAHDWIEDGPDRHTTISYERSGTGWTKRRTYVWERIADPKD